MPLFMKLVSPLPWANSFMSPEFAVMVANLPIVSPNREKVTV